MKGNTATSATEHSKCVTRHNSWGPPVR